MRGKKQSKATKNQSQNRNQRLNSNSRDLVTNSEAILSRSQDMASIGSLGTLNTSTSNRNNSQNTFDLDDQWILDELRNQNDEGDVRISEEEGKVMQKIL